MGKAIVSRDTGEVTLPAVQMAVDHYNTIVQAVHEVMHEGIDYGVVPGTGQKKTLLKPGAEKLCTLFSLRFDPERSAVVDRVEDWDTGTFYYRVRTVLMRGGECVAVGEGSANSRETKWRYRWTKVAKPDEATIEAMKANGSGKFRGAKGGGTEWVQRTINPDIADQLNTILKMAKKRSLVDAVLIAANASEFFTQDLEDLQTIDVQYETQPAEAPAAAAAPAPAIPPPGPASTPPPIATGRPPKDWSASWSPEDKTRAGEILKAMLPIGDKRCNDWLLHLSAYRYAKDDPAKKRKAGDVSPGQRELKFLPGWLLKNVHAKIGKDISQEGFDQWLDSQRAPAAVPLPVDADGEVIPY
jgi:hypothetical protein